MTTVVDKLKEAVKVFQQGNGAKPLMLNSELAWTDPMKLFEHYSFMPYNPSALVTRHGLKIFDQMRKDDQIKAALAFKKHAVLSTEWEVTVPENEDPEWEVAEFVKWNLENFTGTLEESLLGVLSALDFGYSINEKIWEEVETPFGKKIILKELKSRRPHSFDFESDKFGNLNSLLQTQDSKQVALPVDKFVIYVYEKEFGNWYGQSDLESAYRAWWTKTNAYKWMAMFLERLGMPPVFAMYDPQSYNAQQKNDLKDIIVNMQGATSGILPRPTRPDVKGDQILDFWTPELGEQISTIFIPALDMFNRDIARALLMPGLLGFTPDAGEGSYARAQKHFDVFMMVIGYIRQRIQKRVMQEQIVKPLVDLNFGVVDNYPQFKLMPITEQIRLDLLEAWTRAVEKGVVVPQADDEAHVRGQLKFPEKQKGEEIKDVEDEDIEAPAGKSPESAPDLDQGKIKQEPQSAPANSSVGLTSPAVGSLFKSYEDRIISYKVVEKHLDSLEKETLGKLVPLFIKARDSLIGFVERNQNDLMSKLSDLKLRGMNEVRVVLREFLRTSFTFGRNIAREEINSAKRRKVKFVAQMTPIQAIKWFDKWEEFFITDVVREDILKQSKGILLNSIKTGETLSETIKKLNNTFEPFVGKSGVLRGGKPITPARLETIIRTNATTAFNQGKLIEFRENRNILQGVRYSAIMDGRTTPICEHLHGKIFKLDDPDLDTFAPSNHFNCRSDIVGVTIVSKVEEEDFISKSQAGKAFELAQKGFI